MSFSNPVIATLIILSLGSVLTLLMPFFVDPKAKNDTGYFFSFFTLVISLSAFVILMSKNAGPGAEASVFAIDTLTFITGSLILLSALLSLLVGVPYLVKEGVSHGIEFQFLLLAATAGALVFASGTEFVTVFLGLEIMSISIYCMAGAARKKRASAEASLKYLILGCLASAFILYGFAFLYASTGSTSLKIPVRYLIEPSLLLPCSLLFVLVGLAFKVGCPPLHFWVPDVYQGSPTPATIFMACVVKVASFAFLIRILTTTYFSYTAPFVWLFWLAAVLAMSVGNIVALRQRGLKRMLGYSSIAHTGYLLSALAPLALVQEATSAVLFYLFAYCLMSIGAFAIVTVVDNHEENDLPISNLSGLGRTKPTLAVCLTLFLLALAGLPPANSGLIGKVFLIDSALHAGMTGLVIIFLINSAISCFYYLRVAVAVWFVPGESPEQQRNLYVSPTAGGVILACVFGIIALGIYPEPLLKASKSEVDSRARARILGESFDEVGSGNLRLSR